MLTLVLKLKLYEKNVKSQSYCTDHFCYCMSYRADTLSSTNILKARLQAINDVHT